MVVAAPIDQVWRLLLDPKVMAGCVPGVQSVQVLSDNEYLAEIKVRISFISANFRIKTTILETRPPQYLRCEGTGEDSSVASSLKQTTEMFLSEVPGGTEIRTKTHAEVLGRLGSFGLSVMKIKADRMWEDFGGNLVAMLRQDAPPESASLQAAASADFAKDVPSSRSASMRTATPMASPAKSSWWARLAGGERPGSSNIGDLRLATDIYFEIHRGGDVIKVLWPANEAKEAGAWLSSQVRERSK